MAFLGGRGILHPTVGMMYQPIVVALKTGNRPLQTYKAVARLKTVTDFMRKYFAAVCIHYCREIAECSFTIFL